MKTISIKKSEIRKNWWIADAEGQTLGRFASKISQILRGKHKPYFTPHMDMGDFVIILMLKKLVLQAIKKRKDLFFTYRVSWWIKRNIPCIMRKSNPERILMKAVKGMLPHNKLGEQSLII